jgi:hypothetical protein
MNIRILIPILVSATVMSSLSVRGADLHATRTLKQHDCYREGGWTGICVADCDAGMVIVSGGCVATPSKIGLSMNSPSSSLTGRGQWACQPVAAANLVTAFAICE